MGLNNTSSVTTIMFQKRRALGSYLNNSKKLSFSKRLFIWEEMAQQQQQKSRRKNGPGLRVTNRDLFGVRPVRCVGSPYADHEAAVGGVRPPVTPSLMTFTHAEIQLIRTSLTTLFFSKVDIKPTGTFWNETHNFRVLFWPPTYSIWNMLFDKALKAI